MFEARRTGVGKMSVPIVEIYGSMDCPYTYLATFRLRRLWPRIEGRLKPVWRCLSLEYVNKRPVVQPLIEAERPLFARIEPALPYEPWARAAWDWPVTMWPAAEALACAQLQSAEAAMAMSWALRHAFFAGSRNIALRHEIMAIAREVANELSNEASFDVGRFKVDWDGGNMKAGVIGESRRGWRELNLEGSVTFVLPDGRRVTNPALGEVDFDEESYVLRSYEPFEGDALEVYAQMLGLGNE